MARGVYFSGKDYVNIHGDCHRLLIFLNHYLREADVGICSECRKAAYFDSSFSRPKELYFTGDICFRCVIKRLEKQIEELVEPGGLAYQRAKERFEGKGVETEQKK